MPIRVAEVPFQVPPDQVMATPPAVRLAELLKLTAGQTGDKITAARDRMQQSFAGLRPHLAQAQTVEGVIYDITDRKTDENAVRHRAEHAERRQRIGLPPWRANCCLSRLRRLLSDPVRESGSHLLCQ